tara:strand:+ start:166 stop:435 length:270 start_codon:yes stop_codon:yes gene_type:complete
MEILNASEVKNNFGEVLLKAQQGPIGINKNGKAAAVMVSASEYAAIELLREKFFQQEINKGMADIKAGLVVDGIKVMGKLRQKVLDAKL